MKRSLKRFGIGIVIAAAVTVVVIAVSFNSIVRSAVLKLGPKMTRTTVKLDTIRLSPITGRGQVRGLEIGNPEGFATADAIRIGTLNIAMKPLSILSRVVDIESILIDAPEITFEMGIGENNLRRIVKNLRGDVKSPVAGEQVAREEQGPRRKVMINDLVIRNARVSLRSTVLQGVEGTVLIPEIHLMDIGRERGGVSFEEAIATVLNAIVKGSTSGFDGTDKLLGKSLSGLLKKARHGKSSDGQGKAQNPPSSPPSTNQQAQDINSP